MDTNEIMTNEEVVETTEEIVTAAGSGKAIKIAAGVGLSVIIGVVAYQYVAKPMIAKIKAKKNYCTVDDSNKVENIFGNEAEDISD